MWMDSEYATEQKGEWLADGLIIHQYLGSWWPIYFTLASLRHMVFIQHRAGFVDFLTCL